MTPRTEFAGRVGRSLPLADWGLAVVAALALLAASAFIVRAGLPRATDAELHVYRAAELNHVLGEGVFYPRWAPDFYYGYGYPIFNYYAPLTYYLANLLDLILGVGTVGAVQAVFVLGFLLAGVGAYLLGRELFGPESGVVAAACYCFAPYVLFVDPHARGNLAEHFALSLLPLVFYSYRRLVSGKGRGAAFAAGVLGLAALVLSHNLLALVSGALIAAYLVWQAIAERQLRGAGWGGAALLVAACLSAFFWLPALAERHAVKLEVIGPGHFDFHEHFVSIGELLAGSMRLDMGSAAPRFWLNLGPGQWVLALVGIVALALSGLARRRALFFAAAALVLVFLMLPLSSVLWERVPGMEYLQFPWRLLGPAALMLAVCAAAGVRLLRPGLWRRVGSVGATLGVLLLSLPLLYPPEWDPGFGGTEPLDYLEWEQKSLALGTTSTGDYLPVTVLAQLGPHETLIDSYAGPGPVDKVDRAELPDDVAVGVVEHGPLHDRLAIDAAAGFVLRLYTFYFPGWRAYVDGDEVPIEVTEPEGFVSIAVPAGEHEVLVRFGDTMVRTIAWLVSLVGAAGLVAVLAAIPRLCRRRRPPAHKRLNGGAAALAVGVIAIFAALKLAVIDQHDWFRWRSSPGEALPASQPVDVSFGGEIELLGYDLPRGQVRRGGVLSVVLYWRALTDLDTNYQSFVHMTPQEGGGASVAPPAAQDDHLNPGGCPTDRWPTDKYVWDEYELDLPPDLAPGEYVLSAGLYTLGDGTRLRVYDQAGALVGDSYAFATAVVVP
jgi:hypothetical protein